MPVLPSLLPHFMILVLASVFDPLAKSVFAVSCLPLVRLVVGSLWCAESSLRNLRR